MSRRTVGHRSKTTEERSNAAVRRQAAKTPEQRSEQMRKGWRTRRRNQGIEI